MIASFAAMAQLTDQNLRLYGLKGAEIRENSLLTALIVEALAKSAGADAHEAYSAGLLRSVGKIALEGLVYTAGLLRSTNISLWGQDRKAAQKATYDAKAGAKLAEWESEVIGITNCEAAAFILNEWRFPVAIASAIGSHYAPEPASPDPVLANLLNLAAGAADRRGFGLPGEQSYWESRPEKLAAAGIDEAQLDSASERAFARFGVLRSAVV
jgi:HD-like signal output (HDOD) protein